MALRRPLYVMAKPPAEIQAQIMALPRTLQVRPQELLHVTFLSFANLAHLIPGYLPGIKAFLAGFEADAFHIAFDMIVERKAVTLRASRRMSAALAFQRELIDHLRKQGLGDIVEGPIPHLTINYVGDG